MLAKLHMFRWHQLILMLLASLPYTLLAVKWSYNLLVVPDQVLSAAYASNAVPVLTRLGFAVVSLGFAASGFILPSWLVSKCHERRDWFFVFMWMLIAPIFLMLAAGMSTMYVISSTGGDIDVWFDLWFDMVR